VQQVHPLPTVNLGADFNLCTGQEKRLNAGSFKSYNWQNGSTEQYFTVHNKGLYWVKVTDSNNCSATDSVEVKALLSFPSNFLKAVDSICQYDKLQLQPQGSYTSYLWSTGASEPKIIIDKAGTYTLTVTDVNGCKGSDTIRIVQKDCMDGVYIPTAFTPNNDYVNDVFRVKAFGVVISFQLQLYSRLGQLIFSTTDPNKGWDGRLNGLPVDAGTYAYQCTYQIEGSKPGVEKGTVVLIR
jgi:gliding motility-associated-like protein